MKVVIAYTPVLHRGYRDFFMRHADADRVFVLGEQLIAEFDEFRKEIRALHSKEVVTALASWGIGAEIASTGDLELIPEDAVTYMPDEDVSRNLKERFIKGIVVFEPVFLRWDRSRVQAEDTRVMADRKVSLDSFDREVMDRVVEESRRSPDWWRRVGGAVVKNKEIILLAHNAHVPSDHVLSAFGDPRALARRGVAIELGTSIHAEQLLTATAASRGISLRGASLYVSTFPCPQCAKLVAYSGYSKLYYSSGYTVLDGESVLKAKGVEIVFIEMPEEDTSGLEYLPYPEKSVK